VFPSRLLLRSPRARVWRSAALLFGLAACERPREIAVRVSIPGPDSVETPVTGVGVVALPYDRDSVLKQLEARAGTPRPDPAPLDSLFAAFRGPFTAYSAVTLRLTKLRDSVAESKAGADSLRLADSLRATEARAEQARVRLDQARREFVERSDSLRRRMRQWEDSTYQGYDSLVQGLARQSGREAVTDTTGSEGWARLTLAPGRWWIYARSWDAGDPNAEWYWNTPVAGDTLFLSSRNARRQTRY
jgi:hypothetical protein